MYDRLFLVSVIILGLCALVSLGGLAVCAVLEKPEPKSLYGLAGTCVGFIGGILSMPGRNPPAT